MTTWVQRLILANVAIFILTIVSPALYELFVFVPAAVIYRPWTLVTYMFLHASFSHILFNMLGLFFFGPRLEIQLGSRDFLRLFFVSGLFGAILSFIFGPGAPMVGASGAVYGVLFGFARFWPDEPIYIWGVLPIRARWMVVGMAALSLYSGISGSGGNVAHFAHLGGFVGGWLFLRWWVRRRRGAPSAGPTALERISGQTRREVERWRTIRLDGLHPINREEVERVLRKLEAHGAARLTADERAFLNRMSGSV